MSTVDANRVILTGENSVIRLSKIDSDSFTTNATFWRILSSPGGPGHVLYLKSELTESRWRIYADNIAMARVDDLASAAVFLMQHYDQPEIINVGTGEDVTIRELAQQMARSIGYSGRFCFDDSKPDGTPRKLLDVARLHGMGWRHSISLDAGIRKTYEWFLEHEESARMLSTALQN